MAKEQFNDYEAVQSCLNGNKDDFAILTDRYKNLVFSVISKMTNNPDNYADIAQDVFIKVYKNLSKYSPEYHFSTWIIRITANHIIDLRRKKRIESVPIDELDYNITDNRSAEDEYLSQERTELLNRLIDELPETYRLPLVLYHRHNMSYDDIARSLNITLSKVKNRIFKARRLLKDAFIESEKGD